MNTKTTIATNLLNNMSDTEVIQAITKFESVSEAKNWMAQEDWIALGVLDWPTQDVYA